MSTHLDFLCGLLAGWSQIITGQPLDFIKTKYQLSSSTKPSAITFAKQIFKEYGIFGFYRGASSLFFGFGFTIAMQFAIYEQCKRVILSRYQKSIKDGKIAQEILNLKQILFSGAIVGASVSFIYCPIQYAKIQKQSSSLIKQSSFKILISELYQNQLKNIYKGFIPTFLRQTIGSAIYYASYQNAVRQICKIKNIERRFADYSTYLCSGSIAGLSFWIISYPIDFIKTKMQSAQNGQKLKMIQITKNFYKYAYRGFGVIAIRAVIVNGVSFATFQQAKRATLMLSQFAVL